MMGIFCIMTSFCLFLMFCHSYGKIVDLLYPMRHPNASILSPDGAPPNFTRNSKPSFKCHTLSLNVSTHTIDHVYFYDNYVYHVLFQYFVNKIEHFMLIHLQMYLIWRQESGCSQMETCVFTATCI